MSTAPAIALNPVRGILLKLASVALFSVMAACVKAARDVAPAGEAVFFRSFVALLPVLAYAAWRGPIREAVVTRNIRGHFWRGVVGASAMACGFTALGLLPLPEVIAIGFAAPLIATVLAVFLLGEVVRAYRWTAVVIGLIGVMVMVWPRLTLIRGAGLSDAAAVGAAFALSGAFLMALAQIQVRWLTRTEATLAIVFWFHIACSVAALVTLPFGWIWPNGQTWLLLITAGLFGGTAQIFLTESYRQAEASTIAPIDYASMLFGLGIGYFVFAEVPSALVLGGAAIVIAAGLFILMRERRLGILAQRARARRLMSPHG